VEDLQACRLCPRLTDYRNALKRRYPDYHCLPVSGYGNVRARLLIVGLAPGLHGANASGRPFTGDASGDLLFQQLHAYGFASQPTSRACDEMRLIDCRITNAVKCVPPGNLPIAHEKNTCNQYLATEISTLPVGGVLLSLGGVAHAMVLRALGLRQAAYRFRHARQFKIENGSYLLASYHPSRYNINTGKLSASRFGQVIAQARKLLQ
jgi:uracil-DNA glycosylase